MVSPLLANFLCHKKSAHNEIFRNVKYVLTHCKPTSATAGPSAKRTTTMILYHTCERARIMIYEICMNDGGTCS